MRVRSLSTRGYSGRGVRDVKGQDLPPSGSVSGNEATRLPVLSRTGLDNRERAAHCTGGCRTSNCSPSRGAVHWEGRGRLPPVCLTAHGDPLEPRPWRSPLPSHGWRRTPAQCSPSSSRQAPSARPSRIRPSRWIRSLPLLLTSHEESHPSSCSSCVRQDWGFDKLGRLRLRSTLGKEFVMQGATATSTADGVLDS